MPSSILTAALNSGPPPQPTANGEHLQFPPHPPQPYGSIGPRGTSAGSASNTLRQRDSGSFVGRVAHSDVFSNLFFNPPSLPATPHGSHPPAEPPQKEKRPTEYDLGKATLIFREMVDTETRFVDSMRTLVTVFIQPCQSMASATTSPHSSKQSILLHPQVQVFFSTAMQILTLNGQFSEELSSHLEGFDATTNVGAIFLHYAPLFRCYGSYASSHERVSQQLSMAAKEDSGFRLLIEKAQQDGRCKGQTLESLLIMPIQRIPRYRLLLEELRKKTPDSHVGYPDLLGALAQVNDAAVHINESIRRRENREKLNELTERFVTASRDLLDLMDTDVPRQLLREGELIRMTRRGKAVFYFHLFDDLLLYSESTVKGFKLHRRVDLSDRCTVSDRGNSDAEPHAVLISSPQKSFVVCAKSEQEKQEWLSDLTSTISKLQQSGAVDYAASSHSISRHNLLRSSSSDSLASVQADTPTGADASFVAPLWASDHAASHCKLCKSAFTLFNRRHHCRQCGQLVCGACSSNKLLLPAIHASEPQRVCQTCFKAEETVGGAGGAHCLVAGCHGRRDKGPYCSNHQSMSTYADSPSSRQHRSSQSLLGRTRLLGNKKSEGSMSTLASPDKIDKLTFSSTSLPIPDGWRDKVDQQLSLYPQSTRLPIIADLYSSELAYLTSLHMLLDLYIRPLLRLMEASSATNKGRKSEAADIDGKRISPMLAVFLTGVESVYDLSVEVAKGLGGRVDEWKGEESGGVGEVFVRYVGLFQLYTNYGKLWRSAMCELEGGLSPVVKRLEEDAKRRVKANAEREREREESRRESRRYYNSTTPEERDDDKQEAEDDDDPTATVNHAKVSFDPAALAKAALKAKKSRDAKAAEAASHTGDEDDEKADSSLQPPPVPLSVVVPSQSPPPLPPKPLTVTLPDSSPNPLSPSTPSTPVSRNSASSRTSSFCLPSHPTLTPPSATLSALSSAPLQRLSYYMATLSTLLAATPPSNADYAPLTSSLSTLSTLHITVQQVFQEGECVWRLGQLQQKFVGLGGKEWQRDGEEKRRLLKDGRLVKYKGGSSSSSSPLYLHLMSDTLLFSEESGKGYKLNHWQSLLDLQCVDGGKGESGNEHRLLLITTAKQTTVGCATADEKAEWLRAIKQAIKDLYAAGSKKKDAAATSGPAMAGSGMSRSASRNNLVREESAAQAEKDKEREEEKEASKLASRDEPLVKATHEECKQQAENA